jgi:hypothetical protein
MLSLRQKIVCSSQVRLVSHIKRPKYHMNSVIFTILSYIVTSVAGVTVIIVFPAELRSVQNKHDPHDRARPLAHNHIFSIFRHFFIPKLTETHQILIYIIFCFDCIYIAFICCLLCSWCFSRESYIKSMQWFIMVWCWQVCVCVCVCVSHYIVW